MKYIRRFLSKIDDVARAVEVNFAKRFVRMCKMNDEKSYVKERTESAEIIKEILTEKGLSCL